MKIYEVYANRKPKKHTPDYLIITDDEDNMVEKTNLNHDTPTWYPGEEGAIHTLSGSFRFVLIGTYDD